jgi:hypothetical protein
MNRERIIKYNRGRRRTRKCPVPGYRCKRRTRCNKTERRCSISSKPTRRFSRRCHNGSRRQKRGDGCDETGSPKYTRCKNGTRRHKRTHECDRKVGYLLEEEVREEILAKGQRVARRNKSANNVKKQTRIFTLARDEAVLNKYRERRGDNILPRESDENLAADNDENLAANEDEFMGEFDQGDYPDDDGNGNAEVEEDYPDDDGNSNAEVEEDYPDDDGNGNAEVEEEPPPRQLSPILEEGEEEDETSSPRARGKIPKKQIKIHNTRSSSQRTRSETAKNRVNYGSNSSRKSRK